jgi:hypothetical protein
MSLDERVHLVVSRGRNHVGEMSDELKVPMTALYMAECESVVVSIDPNHTTDVAWFLWSFNAVAEHVRGSHPMSSLGNALGLPA